ncbi:flavoprotein, partial [Collinsella vaginalis]|uniref:flavoprotein n=1 Tax=Collinsella vaginalis TaxID=1870987 RepID=UPI002481F246
MSESPTVLLCVTGCIAAYKSCEVLRLLQKAGCRVKVLMTEHAARFVGPTTFRALTGERVAIGLFDDPDDPIHHISLAQEADLVLVAPATANVIAKMAAGIADDLLSTTLLATKAPILVAPAMNTGMWTAEVTRENVARLIGRGVELVGPDSGRLACGDVGSGKLAPVEDIAAAACALLR